jgi:hypothetical protein
MKPPPSPKCYYPPELVKAKVYWAIARAEWLISAEDDPGFCSMKPLDRSITPLNGILLAHRRLASQLRTQQPQILLLLER